MRLFIDRPVATAMVFLVLLALGLFSFLNTPIELAPDEDYPRVDILTSWPGVSPTVILTQVTAPLEEAAATVKGVRKISSESRVGSSRITLELDPKTNFEFTTLALREAVAKVRRNLPFEVRPEVRPFVPEDFQVRPFLRYTISGEMPLQKIRETVKDKLEFRLGAVKGVSRVEVSGGSDPEIRIELDEAKLKAHRIHPYQVFSAIGQSLETLPAGRLKKGTRELVMKVVGSVRRIKDLEDVPVARSGNVTVRLADVARLTEDYGELFSENRINSLPTVMLTVSKEKGRSTLRVAREVKTALEEVRRELPPNLTFKTVDDESLEIRKNLNRLLLLAALITGLILLTVFLVLRRLRPSLLVLSSVAFSVVITFLLIYFFRISLNMLTLGALALGFGIFVDNSVVVFENILRRRETGLSPREAALRGPKEVFLLVLASTLTTIAVFVCFPFFQGRLKIYYLPLAVVMSSALAASILVSFSLIPALSPGLLKVRKKKPAKTEASLFENILGAALRHPLEVVLLSAALLYGSYRWFRAEVTIGEFFRWYSRDRLVVSISMPPGTAMEETDAVVRKFERKALEADCEKEVNAVITAERASIVISFPPAVELSFRPYLLKEELIGLATQFAGLSIGVFGFDPQSYYSSMEAGTYYDSQIKFYGYNLKKLGDITAGLEQTLKQNPRIQEVRIVSSRFGRWRSDSNEYILKIDPEKLRGRAVDPDFLYFSLTTLLGRRFSAPMRAVLEGEEKKISIKIPAAENMDIGTLLESLVGIGRGESVRLRDISQLEEQPVAGAIDREDQRFQQIVMWEFRGPYKAADRYKRAVFAGLSLPPGFSATLEEERLMTTEEKGQIRLAVLFALVLIAMILASLYESFLQPLFILASVPLALVGVFTAFVIADYPFDSSAYIGVILLAGIVVNNAILLVNHMNLKRSEGLPLREAVVRGAAERLRPIFMTTGTTVLAMLPLLLIQLEEGRRQIWSSLALATVGWLITSALFTLIVIPLLYYYAYRNRT